MDNVDGLRTIVPDASIDFCLTSPPYDHLRKYHGYLFRFEELAKELYRVMKPGGVVVWVVGDQTIKGSETGTSFRQALFFMQIGFLLYDTMIYHKLNARPGRNPRYKQAFEYMFVFSKGKPKTFHPLKEPCKYAGSLFKQGDRQSDGAIKRKEKRPIPPMKVRENIWHYSVGYLKSTKDRMAFEHPAIFPEQLAEDHIRSWTKEGDLVLDPFMGSGTTAKVAQQLNRDYVGFEISPHYLTIAQQRLRQKEVIYK
jgi:site-specific DNA-methyltransferase (adenine-specific)